jgi:hypothetical protein
MSAETKIPTGWTKPRPQPQEPEIDWVSLEKLLDEYTIPILAEAVEKLDVLTHDDTGRRILATNGDVSDTKSKAYALKHLELRYSMQNDPGPDDYLYDEMLETHGSPLDLFGWLKSELPNLESINPHHSLKNKTAPITTSPANWVAQAHAIAKKFIDKNKSKDLHPSLDDTADHVANELRKLKIYGQQAKPLSSGTVKRQALQGKWWKNRNSPKTE